MLKKICKSTVIVLPFLFPSCANEASVEKYEMVKDDEQKILFPYRETIKDTSFLLNDTTLVVGQDTFKLPSDG